MSPEQKPFAQALESLARWVETHWKIVAGLAIWAVFVLAIFFVGNMQLSDRIQAASMITMIFITIYYAIQTQALVKEERRALDEERNRRIAEFGEKRIVGFLEPLRRKFDLLRSGMSVLAAPSERSPEELLQPLHDYFLKDIWPFYKAHKYLADGILQHALSKFTRDVEACWPRKKSQDDASVLIWHKEMENGISTLDYIIGADIKIISKQIQSTYEYYVKKPVSFASYHTPPTPPE